MQTFSAFILLFMLLALPCPSMAEEEIYPGFNKCNEGTETMGQENVCWGKAVRYWAGKLEVQYAKIRKDCATSPNPEQCKDRLKKMQVGWLNYVNSMAGFLKNGLLHEQEFATTSSIYESLQFEAWATRKQCEMLRMLE